jgi:hypothetical protein
MPDHAMTYKTPRNHQPASSGGLDLKTLWITAAASAAAAYACSRLWAPGTLAAAAFTPVLVALIKEALAKSTDVVTRVVPVKGVVRSTPPSDPQPYDPTLQQTAAEMPVYEPPPAGERVAQAGEIQYHGGRGMRGWRLAVVTGLLGFLICAVVFTVPELVAGESASGGGRDTTLFGGGKERDRNDPAVTTQTTTVPVETVTSPAETTVTVPPATTVTVPPPAVTTTTPTTTTPPEVVPEEPGVGQPPAPQPPG